MNLLPRMSQKKALENQTLGWRALAILAAASFEADRPEVTRRIRTSILTWTFRPPEDEEVQDLIERAQKAGFQSGWFTE